MYTCIQSLIWYHGPLSSCHPWDVWTSPRLLLVACCESVMQWSAQANASLVVQERRQVSRMGLAPHQLPHDLRLRLRLRLELVEDNRVHLHTEQI